MKKVSRLFLILIILIVIAGGVIFFMPKYSAESIDPDHTETLSQLDNAFKTSEEKANTKYIGSIVATEGIIQEISKDQSGASVLLLSNTEKSQPILLCTMESGETTKINKLKVGDRVKLKGQCTGKLLEIVMKNGILLD